jgi:hypothetical protein
MTWNDYKTRPPLTALAPIPGYGKIFDSNYSPSEGHERAVANWPLLPWPRGPLSAFVVSALQRQPGTLGSTPPISRTDALSDDDFELALYLCYEMHFRGLASAEWAWDPGLKKFRSELERAFVNRLRDEINDFTMHYTFDTVSALDEVIEECAGSSLMSYFDDSGTIDQFREFCVHRSVYQFRADYNAPDTTPQSEFDPVPASTSVRFEDLGSSVDAQLRSSFFSTTMSSLGLDNSHGSYVEIVPGVTLATVNLKSMFSFHPHWRAAMFGHAAASEVTSLESMERYCRALNRFGLEAVGRRFVDVAVPFDARRPLIARNQVFAELLTAEPKLATDVIFGAAAVLLLEQRFADHLLDAWTEDRTSLVPWETYERQSPTP